MELFEEERIAFHRYVFKAILRVNAVHRSSWQWKRAPARKIIANAPRGVTQCGALEIGCGALLLMHQIWTFNSNIVGVQGVTLLIRSTANIQIDLGQPCYFFPSCHLCLLCSDSQARHAFRLRRGFGSIKITLLHQIECQRSYLERVLFRVSLVMIWVA